MKYLNKKNIKVFSEKERFYILSNYNNFIIKSEYNKIRFLGYKSYFIKILKNNYNFLIFSGKKRTSRLWLDSLKKNKSFKSKKYGLLGIFMTLKKKLLSFKKLSCKKVLLKKLNIYRNDLNLNLNHFYKYYSFLQYFRLFKKSNNYFYFYFNINKLDSTFKNFWLNLYDWKVNQNLGIFSNFLFIFLFLVISIMPNYNFVDQKVNPRRFVRRFQRLILRRRFYFNFLMLIRWLRGEGGTRGIEHYDVYKYIEAIYARNGRSIALNEIKKTSSKYFRRRRLRVEKNKFLNFKIFKRFLLKFAFFSDFFRIYKYRKYDYFKSSYKKFGIYLKNHIEYELLNLDFKLNNFLRGVLFWFFQKRMRFMFNFRKLNFLCLFFKSGKMEIDLEKYFYTKFEFLGLFKKYLRQVDNSSFFFFFLKKKAVMRFKHYLRMTVRNFFMMVDFGLDLKKKFFFFKRLFLSIFVQFFNYFFFIFVKNLDNKFLFFFFKFFKNDVSFFFNFLKFFYFISIRLNKKLKKKLSSFFLIFNSISFDDFFLFFFSKYFFNLLSLMYIRKDVKDFLFVKYNKFLNYFFFSDLNFFKKVFVNNKLLFLKYKLKYDNLSYFSRRTFLLNYKKHYKGYKSIFYSKGILIKYVSILLKYLANILIIFKEIFEIINNKKLIFFIDYFYFFFFLFYVYKYSKIIFFFKNNFILLYKELI